MNGKNARDKPLGILAAVRAWAADLLLITGAVMVAVGAGMIYTPAGWIAGGTLTILGGVLAARGASGGDDR